MIGLILNIAAFVLAIYLSVIGRRRRVKRIAWASALLITIGNVFVYFSSDKEKPYFGLITPNISAIEAYETINRLYKRNLNSYDLVDVIGSYYICLEKPNTIFHRFPEWTFVFRNRSSNLLVEYRVSDNRIPMPPRFDDIDSRIKKYWRMQRVTVSEPGEIASDGYIAYYIVAKKAIHVGGPLNETRKAFLEIFDKDGRNLISTIGTGPDDDLSETSDGITSIIVARSQIVGRVTTHISDWREDVNINKMRTLIIRSASLSSSEFYKNVSPIESWTIDIDEAIASAKQEGGIGFPLGKPRIGGPGIVRLYNGIRGNIEGSYWEIPYRIRSSPVLVSAIDGTVLVMDEKALYTSDVRKAVDLDISFDTKTLSEGIDINDFLSGDSGTIHRQDTELERVRLLERGVSHFRSENYGEAIKHFSKSVKLDPEKPEGYINRGLSFARLGMHETAIDDYTKGISIRGTEIAYVNRSISYKQLGKYDLAISDANRTLELNAENDEAYFTRGNSYRAKGQIDQAIADYTKAVEYNPLYADAYYNRGTLLGQYFERNKDALSDFNRAIQLNSNDPAYYINRAIAYFSLGENDKACRDFDSACRLGSCEPIREARIKGLCE